MMLRRASVEDAPALAEIHARSFDPAWSADDLAALLSGAGVLAVMAEDEAPFGFALIQTIAEQAEVLTLAVDPARRRAGVGRALITTSLAAARVLNAEAMFLEVAVDNTAAHGLYTSLGFETAGRRAGYYRRADGMVDALILRRSLNTDV
jgi:[ribosomal protein S18]-alanine N-acetyltransferase